MTKHIMKLGLISLVIILFSGCAKYYSNSLEEHETFKITKQIPVKVELQQTDWSIVINLSDENVKENVSDVLFDNPIFIEDETSNKVLKIDIKHSNDHGGAEMGNAILTGASLYLIPGVADSVVDINVSMDKVSSDYQGELIVAQGMGASAMIDKAKYTEDSAFNLMKNLIKNAIDKFTLVYLEDSQKLEN